MSKKKVITIAEYFVSKNKADKKGLTNKKVQKLLYYSQAWSLVLRDGKKMFNDSIEAWVHGPAIPAVYFYFKEFGANEIDIDVDEKKIAQLKQDEKNILDTIWSIYGKYDASYLEILSHSETPWQEARKDLNANEASSNKISLSSMKRYYGEKIAKK